MRSTGNMHLMLLAFGLGLAEATSRSVHGSKWQDRPVLLGYYLFCDALERTLKSDLKRSGFSERDLRNIGRDLREVVDMAIENRSDEGRLSPELKECIGMLSAYYRENEFDYFSRVLAMRLPDTRQFSGAVSHLLKYLDARYRAG